MVVLPSASAQAYDTSTITQCVRDDAARFNCTKYVYQQTGKALLLAHKVKNTGTTTLTKVNCGFSDSATFSSSYSATVSASVKASWMSVVSAEAGFSVTATVGVRATQASAMSVETSLKPGQTLTSGRYHRLGELELRQGPGGWRLLMP